MAVYVDRFGRRFSYRDGARVPRGLTLEADTKKAEAERPRRRRKTTPKTETVKAEAEA